MGIYFKALSIITYFGSGLCLLMALEQLLSKDRNRANYLCSVLLTCNSIIIYNLAVLASITPPSYPSSIFPFFTALYLIGPIDYMYFYSLVYPEFRISLKMKIQLIPAIISLIVESIIHFTGNRYEPDLLIHVVENPLSNWVTPFVVLAAFLVLGYMIYLLKNILLARNQEKIREGVLVVILANALAIIMTFLSLYGFLARNKHLMLSGGFLLTVIHIGIFLAHSRNADFFQLLKQEIRNGRYRRSIIKGLDNDLINEQINNLMNEEKLFSNYELKLNDLARRLSLTPHQLSEFINGKYNMSFPHFINSFRIEEAKKLLITNPEQSVISICFQVGFSSKSAFNAAFRKSAGRSPVEYREENQFSKGK